jgi:ribosome modulation factor
MKETVAFRQGWNAYVNGVSFYDCPLQRLDKKKEWRDGWQAAEACRTDGGDGAGEEAMALAADACLTRTGF